MTGEAYRVIEDYMRRCMAESAHDREHVYRVLYLALDIAETEIAADRDILIAAALIAALVLAVLRLRKKKGGCGCSSCAGCTADCKQCKNGERR